MRRVNLRFQNYPSETMDQYIKAERSNWVSAADLRPNSFDPAPDIFFSISAEEPESSTWMKTEKGV